MVPKMWFRTIFRTFFGLVFRTLSRGLKKKFFIEPSEMVQGIVKNQKGSLLNQYPKVTLNNVLQWTIMGKNGQTSKAMSRV